MRGKLKQAARLTALLSLCFIMLAGCGRSGVPAAITVPTISVSDKGAVTSYLVSDFDKDYYDIDELHSMAEEEAAQYNSSHNAPQDSPYVSVESVEMASDKSARAVVTMKFKNTEAYGGFNGTTLYYGTIAQAHEEGFDLDVELVSVKDGASVGRKEIYDMSARHILIINEKLNVVCPKKPLYISKGAVLNSDGTVDLTQTEGSAYIILK